ncbi:MAG TPA: trypsin-like peptidase domain-containing protein [Kiloniellales bacterium]|nr:trypsin-like peptidase domain-containing protein [Kiloniellales bacterium]
MLDSVVSVLPHWPGYARGGRPELPPGAAPEGTAVAIAPGGYLVTALHVVDRALEIEVRLPDGRQVLAELVGGDPASDLAVLRIETELPLLPDAPEPELGAPVCAVGNAFGLDLSVTCGVVSALHRSGVGFNEVEDFVQTDASVNPGASGGALVDREGRLVGILSAIFTKGSDADIGVNFAASTALVRRVVPDLIERGRVVPAHPGLKLGELSDAERRRHAGVLVLKVEPGGAAEAAGIEAGDLVTAIAGRPVRSVAAVRAAIALRRPGDRVEIALAADGEPRVVTLVLGR